MNERLQSESGYLDPARVRASFYCFINVHFLDLPDERFVGLLRGEAFDSVLEELRQSKEAPREITAGAGLMQTYLRNTMDLDHKELAKRLGVDRTRLYRGVSPHSGFAPPYEALWIGEVGESDLLYEMAGIYREGGFTLKADIHDRLDYIGIQLNFMERLVMKEVAAREAGDEEAVQAALNDQRNFMLQHVGKWAPGFASGASGHAQTDFYRGHLFMVKGFIEQEKAMLEEIQAVQTSR